MQYPIIDTFAQAYINNGWTGINIPATVTYTPIQLGSGDPSPDNVRPILPATTLNIGGVETPIYGGSLDVATGVLSVGAYYTTLADATQYIDNDTYIIWQISNIPSGASVYGGNYAKCNITNTFGSVQSTALETRVQFPRSTNTRLFISMPSDIIPSDVTVCYELATPTTYQLTAQELGKALSLDKDISHRLKLPMQHYFPHPVIDALQAAAAGTQTAEQTEILRHYLTPLGIGGI